MPALRSQDALDGNERSEHIPDLEDAVRIISGLPRETSGAFPVGKGRTALTDGGDPFMGTRHLQSRSDAGPSDLTVFFEKVPIFKGLRAATQRYLHPKADFSFRKTGVPFMERRFFMPVFL